MGWRGAVFSIAPEGPQSMRSCGWEWPRLKRSSSHLRIPLSSLPLSSCVGSLHVLGSPLTSLRLKSHSFRVLHRVTCFSVCVLSTLIGQIFGQARVRVRSERGLVESLTSNSWHSTMQCPWCCPCLERYLLSHSLIQGWSVETSFCQALNP